MNILDRALCIWAIATITAAAPIEAQDRALGQWHGVLATPTGELTLFVRIHQGADGGHRGDLESVSQGSRKIPLAMLVVSADTLAFSIPSIGATYEGQWNEAEQAWSGVFRQGMTLPLLLKRGAPPATMVVEGLDGTWRGSLRRGTMTLRLVLHVRTTPRGTAVSLDLAEYINRRSSETGKVRNAPLSVKLGVTTS